MNRNMEILPFDVLKSVQMAARRPASLGAGDIESNNTIVPVADRQFGYLQRPSSRAHGGKQGIHRDTAAFAALAETVGDRLDDLVQGEPALGMELGSKPDFGVDDAVRGQILSAFGSPPGQ